MLDIKAKPSSLFVNEDQPEEEGAEPTEGEFNWHCKSGLAGNIQQVLKEFCTKRGLKPFKIALFGKPCTGKSHFSKELAEHYKVPHIHTTQVLHDIEHWQDEREENYRNRKAQLAKINEEAEKQKVRAMKAKEEAEKKAAKARADAKLKRKIELGDEYVSDNEEEEKPKEPAEGGEANADGDPADPESMAARIILYQKHLKQYEIDQVPSDDEIQELELKQRVKAFPAGEKIDQELLSEVFRWRLSQNDCQNRGYVLDGYPFSYETSRQVFFIQPQPPAKKAPELDEDGNPKEAEEEPLDEEALAELMKPKFQKHIYPEHVIMLRGDDNNIRDFAKTLTPEQNTKWTRENLERRLDKWNADNHISLFRQANSDPNLGLPSAKQWKLPMMRFY